PFFCMHPRGGYVHPYIDLVKYLGPDQPFYGLQSYGLDAGQTPLTRVEEMAERYIEAIRKRQPKGPYYIGRWSLGGLIAYEVGRQLRDLGEELALLLILDMEAPIERAEHEMVSEELFEAKERQYQIYWLKSLGLTFDEREAESMPLEEFG